jgi:hypothetical protein
MAAVTAATGADRARVAATAADALRPKLSRDDDDQVSQRS